MSIAMKKSLYLALLFTLSFSFASSAQTNIDCVFGDTLSIELTDVRGTIQWQSSSDSLIWADITGQNSIVLDYLPFSGTQWVRAVLNEDNCPEFICEPIVINAIAGGGACGVITSVTDIDGNEYPVIEIGNQCWTKENLKTTKYSDGSLIPNITVDATWANLNTPAWCNYNNSPTNDAIYGKLYNWYSVADPRNICPAGWHVPSDTEWTTLTDYLGGESVAGGKMKTISYWNAPNTGATNESGFSGLPGGFRSFTNGTFGLVGNSSFWWSSSVSFSTSVWTRSLGNTNDNVGRNNYNMRDGLSVRCLRD